jgi:hypothetical protein
MARANSEFFRYLLTTLSLKKPSTYAHRLYTCLHSLRLFVRLSVCSVVLDDRQNIARAYGTGVGARRGH